MGNRHPKECACKACIQESRDNYILYDRHVRELLSRHREVRLAFESRHDAKEQMNFRLLHDICQPRAFPPGVVFTPEAEAMFSGPKNDCKTKK